MFPESLMEENIQLIPPLGEKGYGTLDYNYMLETWTKYEQDQAEEKLTLMQEHMDEKKMLCDKLKELG